MPYRMQWEDDFLSYLKKLEEHKPVIFCGDLNVAHREIDLKNPKSNRKNAGFTDEERGKFTQLLESDLLIRTDIFIRIRKEYTPGGHTGSRPAKRMQDGALIISVCQKPWKTDWRAP